MWRISKDHGQVRVDGQMDVTAQKVPAERYLHASIGGSVVEFSPATREARVRFPANAAAPFLFPMPMKDVLQNNTELFLILMDSHVLQNNTESSIMSGLNASLGYFVSIIIASAAGRLLLRRWRPRWAFTSEFVAAFALAACRLEVDTIAEVGQWAGALGPDVAVTMLFISILVHGLVMQDVSGNPALTLMGVLLNDVGIVAGALIISAQMLGALAALAVAGRYWALELSDMHMIKNLMMSECSTSLRASVLQGALVEAVGTGGLVLLQFALRRRSALMKIPAVATLLTAIAYAGNNYTSGYVNPSLAYAMTFTCPGHSFLSYSLVYWIGPLIGMILALFLYSGNIPLLFSRNLLYSRKSRFRVPKGKTSEDKTS